MARTRSNQSRLMRRFSTLAGPLQSLRKGQNYKVEYTSLLDYDQPIYRIWTRFVAYGALLLTITLAAILFHPSNWIINQQPDSKFHAENLVMLICLILLQLFAIIGTYSATRSTIKARDPVPVTPPKGLRIAFATTRAPGEPVSMVRKTLTAMKQARYKGGSVDVWLLDETNDDDIRDICKELDVNYFTRSGIPGWNTRKETIPLRKRLWRRTLWLLSFGHHAVPKPAPADPFLAGRSKHGNYNAWRHYIAEYDYNYDILAGVDTDQVPEPNYLERVLGYFRDPDVAYVVGPQVYGNYKPGLGGLVARWAESQASFFQSTIQRAGNASNSAMFVGTNYAVRMRVLDQINGFQPCITEDMATGLAIHTRRNPDTGNIWKSVYTPDVLAIGEGPDFWGPYFTQQWRWAAGTFDTWRRVVWRIWFKLHPKAMLHYFLMLTYYPMTALTWLLGTISSVTYLTTGATAVLAPWSMFISLYLTTLTLQLGLYFWNRRFNVSPHEPEGSYGVAGMFISTITAPIYLSALAGITFGKKPHFVVTTKGGGSNPDWLPAFRSHLQWAAIIMAALVVGFLQDHFHPAMVVWAGLQLFICLTPFVLGMSLAVPERISLLVGRTSKAKESRNA